MSVPNDWNDFPAWVDRKAIEESLAKYRSPAQSMGERIDGIIDGTIRPIATPWEQFDDIKAAMPGTLNVVCGDPGSAKSFLVLQLMAHAHRAGVGVGLLELECSRDWHLMRYLAQLAGEPKVTSLDWIAANPERIRSLMDLHRSSLNSLGNVMDVADGKLLTHRDVLRWAQAKLEQGAKLLAIDPITAMQPSERPWEDDQNLITGLRRLMERHHAAGWLVTHPKKGRKREISMEVLAGGAAISRFTDVVLWLERLEKPETHVVFGARRWDGTETEVVHRDMVRVLRVLKCRDGVAAGRNLSVRLNPTNLTVEAMGWIKRVEKPDAQAADCSPF